MRMVKLVSATKRRPYPIWRIAMAKATRRLQEQMRHVTRNDRVVNSVLIRLTPIEARF